MTLQLPTVKDIKQLLGQLDCKLVGIKENAALPEAAALMKDNNIGCLVVFDGQGKFAGILSERDFLSKAFTTGDDTENILVKDIMTKNAIFCKTDTPIREAEEIMDNYGIRHLPIAEGDTPVSMLSSRDIIAYRLKTNEAMKSAAEQLAILSARLKGLDCQDMTEFIIDQVPQAFEAQWAVLHLKQKDSSASMFYRKGCPLSEGSFTFTGENNDMSQNGNVIYGQICSQCEKKGGCAPRLVIPVGIGEQFNTSLIGNSGKQGFLCMCCLGQSSANTDELQIYKASLLQNILNVNLLNADLYRNYKKARHDSEIDILTGVGTRRVLQRVLESEHSRALRYNHPFSVAVLDLDNFKQINDGTGHAAGDMALQQIARVIRGSLRGTDVFTRYGGDEFVLIMPETELSDAYKLIDKLRRTVKNTPMPKFIQPITISCGIAQWARTLDDNAENILKRADEAMYKAKKGGRDCVVASEVQQQALSCAAHE